MYKTITIKTPLKTIKCTAKTICVSDLMQIYRMCGDKELSNETIIELIKNDIDSFIELSKNFLFFDKSIDLSRFGNSQISDIIENIINVNSFLFTKSDNSKIPSQQTTEKSSVLTGNDLFKILAMNCEAITRIGHQNALNYDYDYFMIVMEQIEIFVNEQKRLNNG
jgi:hypothetical protein